MEEKTVKKPHCCIINDRNSISLTGITDVGNFDENTVVLFSDYGMISVSGENIQVLCVDTQTGKFEAQGIFYSVTYCDNKKKHQSFISKVFR